MVVSVTYIWSHPLIEMLGLRPPEPTVFITEDLEHWRTGSIITDLYPDLVDFHENEPLYVLPFEDV